MGLTAKQGGKDLPLLSEGVKLGVCYLVCDLGTHTGEYDGRPNIAHKVVIGWELPSERMEYEVDGEMKDMPRVISQFYTLSLDPKANLRKALDAWRGKPFSKQELDGFDIKKLLGVGCQVQVIHKAGEGGDVRDRVNAVMALPQGMTAPEAVLPHVYFSFEDWDGVSDISEKVPPFVWKWVSKSQEWTQAVKGNEALDAAHEHDDATPDDFPPVGENTGDEEDSDQIPF